jgi:hypothetical protein
MALASLQLVNESIQKILGLANHTKIPPTVNFVTIGIASVTVGMFDKLIQLNLVMKNRLTGNFG